MSPALLAAALFAARVSFQRTVPAPHNLGVDHVAVVYAIGDNQNVSLFVDEFVGLAGRAGTLRIDDAVDNNRRVQGFTPAALQNLRRLFPADAYIGISLFTCAGAEHTGEVGDLNSSGERIHTRLQWLDAVCSAKIEARKADGKLLATFMTHGEGTSPRVTALTADDRDIAYAQATRLAAFSAAEAIAPRVLRESVELDDRAPAYDDGIAMIRSDRLADARAIWEVALQRNRNSASLQYNLAAVSEALGDLQAAESYYRDAVHFAPGEPRYRTGLNLFLKRYGISR